MRTISLLLVLIIASPVLADEPKVQRGIPYAEPKNERQMLDVYAPTKGKSLPVVVWIHGGGWRRGDKADVHNKPKAFVDKGFVLVSISYRFVPNVTVDQIAGDVAKAIRWTHDHAKDYGGDPNTIIVAGHSAGAQLAALVCTDDRYLKAEKLSLSIIKGCVPVDGDTYDVPMQIKTVEEKRAKSYRMTFGDEASQKNLSAVTHVAKGKNIPPFLILHVADHPETKAQSQRLVKVLEAAGISAKAYPAEGKNHTTINVDLGLADDRPTQEMFSFLSAVLKAQDAAEKQEVSRLNQFYPNGFHFVDTLRADGKILWISKEVVGGKVKAQRLEIASLDEFKKEFRKANVNKEASIEVHVRFIRIEGATERAEAILQFLKAEGYKKAGAVSN
jgi:arylformamidase